MKRPVLSIAGLVALTVALASPAFSGVTARAFEVKFKSLADAAELVSPLLSPQGTVTLQPRLKTLTVQDQAEVLDRIAAVLKSFDTAPRDVEIAMSLFLGTDRREQEAGRSVPPETMTRDVRGIAETLGDFTKWNSYEPLGGRAVTAAEGGRVTASLSDEYRVAYDVETVRDDTVRLTNFVLQRVTRSPEGKETVQDVYSAAVVLPVGRMLMLGAAQNPESKRALFLTLRARPR
ncbi:MAG TPA: secretin N-terminal domain-containing protein [Candidatus Polarisedimenticolaceae bacterium]|nr:secretin N-terminal domain-containing protein [Candidatus Polarisedimenticolaceae bacterium]